MITGREGTVIRATLRSEDLIPAFIDELDNLQDAMADAFRDNWDALSLVRDYLKQHGINNSEVNSSLDHDTDCLIEDLFDALDKHAAEGMYFGAHEGDGSDFGFWHNLFDEFDTEYDAPELSV